MSEKDNDIKEVRRKTVDDYLIAEGKKQHELVQGRVSSGYSFLGSLNSKSDNKKDNIQDCLSILVDSVRLLDSCDSNDESLSKLKGEVEGFIFEKCVRYLHTDVNRVKPSNTRYDVAPVPEMLIEGSASFRPSAVPDNNENNMAPEDVIGVSLAGELKKKMVMAPMKKATKKKSAKKSAKKKSTKKKSKKTSTKKKVAKNGRHKTNRRRAAKNTTSKKVKTNQ